MLQRKLQIKLRSTRLTHIFIIIFCLTLQACGGGGGNTDSPQLNTDLPSVNDNGNDANGDSTGDSDNTNNDDNPNDNGEQPSSNNDITYVTTPQLQQSGNWSDSATWQDGALPDDEATFTIPAGITLTVDGEISKKLKAINIEGKLKFATNVNTSLLVETIKSQHSGELEIGSENNPIDHNVTAKIQFADFGVIDRNIDPKQLSRGAVLMGTTNIWGAEKTAWAILAEHPHAGDASLILKTIPTGWKVGDRLVIAATKVDDPTSDEVAVIDAINGKIITLSSPLTKNHIAFKDDLDVHVANLTRNIEFSSQNSEITHRGHVMFMHTLNVNVNNARFYQLGRTDKSIPLDDFTWPELDDAPPMTLDGNNIRGRYSVHFHRGGVAKDSQSALVKGSVVEDDPGWAYVNHSSNVEFIENVSYNVVGGAFQTEAGDEMGAFIRNIALRTINPNDPMNCNCEQAIIDVREDRQDFSFQGDGFWLHGGGPSIEGNVVAGASGHAYVYWPEGLIEIIDGNSAMTRIDVEQFPNNHLLTTDGKIDVWYYPVESFKNNVGYNATKGLEFYYLHAHNFFTGNQEPVTDAYVEQLSSSFENITLWNMKQHALGFNYTERVKFKNIRLVNNGDESKKAISAGHFHNLTAYTFENLSIEDYGIGMEVPTQGKILIQGGQFSSKTDFRIENPQTAPRELLFQDISFVESDYFDDNDRVHFEMTPDFTLRGKIHDDATRGDSPKHPLFFVMPDRIKFDFGAYQNMGLYFDQQRPDFIPMRAENASYGPEDGEQLIVPEQAVDKTNQTLKDEYELYFGGAFIPNDAISLPNIVGGKLGSPAPQPEVFPPDL